MRVARYGHRRGRAGRHGERSAADTSGRAGRGVPVTAAAALTDHQTTARRSTLVSRHLDASSAIAALCPSTTTMATMPTTTAAFVRFGSGSSPYETGPQTARVSSALFRLVLGLVVRLLSAPPSRLAPGLRPPQRSSASPAILTRDVEQSRIFQNVRSDRDPEVIRHLVVDLERCGISSPQSRGDLACGLPAACLLFA